MSAVGATERVYQIIDRVPLLDNTAGEALGANFRGDVEFRGVSFAYPSRPSTLILNNVSFSIRAGTVAAIVGRVCRHGSLGFRAVSSQCTLFLALCRHSGAGKSTIFSLIERLYDPQVGIIALNCFFIILAN